MTGGALLLITTHWVCPNCKAEDVTREALPHTRMHICSVGRLAGITSPMVRAGTKAKVEARDRDDYVGKEHAQVDANGRPLMSIVTTRDDGQDCVVFAPVVQVRIGVM